MSKKNFINHKMKAQYLNGTKKKKYKYIDKNI